MICDTWEAIIVSPCTASTSLAMPRCASLGGYGCKIELTTSNYLVLEEGKGGKLLNKEPFQTCPSNHIMSRDTWKAMVVSTCQPSTSLTMSRCATLGGCVRKLSLLFQALGPRRMWRRQANDKATLFSQIWPSTYLLIKNTWKARVVSPCPPTYYLPCQDVQFLEGAAGNWACKFQPFGPRRRWRR